jgi:2-keto-4-pentenoate hydratase
MYRDPADAAKWLFDAHVRRTPFMPVPGRQAGDTLDQAYDIQDQLVPLLSKEKGHPVGYKIGLTTPRMQQMCGIDHPIAGIVLSKRVYYAPFTVDLANFVRLGIECELAVRLSRTPIDPEDMTLAGIAGCVRDVAPAFELVEDRSADYKALDLYSLVADNSWNEGAVLGKPSPAKRLGDLQGVLAINGAVADRGNSRDVLGHPLEAVMWLGRHLARRGKALLPDEWVMTGSIVPTKFASRGDEFIFSLENFDPISVTVK